MRTKKIQSEEKVILSSKGQLVIPKAIRAYANLHDGEELLLRVREDNVIELSPIRNTIEDLFSLIPKSYEKNRVEDDILLTKYFSGKRK